ncbi:MAG: hypothetical protein Q8R70_00195 [Methanoregula sp.]|nr:hypothetical protein [Methanoregula sp.]
MATGTGTAVGAVDVHPQASAASTTRRITIAIFMMMGIVADT